MSKILENILSIGGPLGFVVRAIFGLIVLALVLTILDVLYRGFFGFLILWYGT